MVHGRTVVTRDVADSAALAGPRFDPLVYRGDGSDWESLTNAPYEGADFGRFASGCGILGCLRLLG